MSKAVAAAWKRIREQPWHEPSWHHTFCAVVTTANPVMCTCGAWPSRLPVVTATTERTP